MLNLFGLDQRVLTEIELYHKFQDMSFGTYDAIGDACPACGAKILHLDTAVEMRMTEGKVYDCHNCKTKFVRYENYVSWGKVRNRKTSKARATE